MAYFAKVEDGLVTNVIVAEKDFIDALPDAEQWVETCYGAVGGVRYDENGIPINETAFRKNYAGPGFSYDSVADVFIPPRPYPSWVLNTETYLWDSPIPRLEAETAVWDEDSRSWLIYE